MKSPGHRQISRLRKAYWLGTILLAGWWVLFISWDRSSLRAEEKVLRAWTFDRAGDLEGWRPGGDVGNTRVEEGLLRTTVVGPDPILVHDVFVEPLPASPFQVVELRLFAPRQGLAELFWTNTTATRYGGFSPEKRTPFVLKAGWHTYRIWPFWQAEGRIIRLRVDLPPFEPGDAPLEYLIDYIRIVETGARGTPGPASWDFSQGLGDWQLEGEGMLTWAEGALSAVLHPGARLLAPAVDLEAEKSFFISFEMAVDQPGVGQILYATQKSNGLHAYNFPLAPGPKPRVYNVPVGGQSTWQSPIVYLALEVRSDTPVRVQLLWMKAAVDPQGRADLQVDYFQVRDALPRVGHVHEVIVQISNRGGDVADHVRAHLELPEGLYFAAGGPLIKNLPPVDYFSPARFSWRIFSRRPGPATLRLSITGPDQLVAECTENFTMAPQLSPADYVPEPKPVRGDYEVGVYYFPGWGDPVRWQPLEAFPERRPVLGYYREGLPEVADWHIKWAVEHGITFFCYDWYWTQGHRRLEHALHDGYFNAKYRDLMKFCLLWANHFGPGEHSEEDSEAVCRYWIENYFRLPQYFKIDGRPLVVIFSVYSMERDLGVEGTRKVIARWHELTQQAGVGKIFVAGCGAPAQLPRIKEMGFDAITGYNWPNCGLGERRWARFEEVAANYDSLWWRPLARAGLLPVITPVSAGWDARPWHGNRALVLSDCTPEAFEKHLRAAKRFVDETNQPKVLLIEAWNEWGEGSYCEPHKQHGFGHVEAIRRVFCPQSPPPIVFGPRDVGLPLPEFELAVEEEPRTVWDFTTGTDPGGWSNLMQLEDLAILRPSELSDWGLETGGLFAVAGTNDPALVLSTKVRAKEFEALEISIALRGAREKDVLQVFWASPLTVYREEASVRIPVVCDGKLRTYRLPLAQHPLWRGMITQLRVDPCATAGTKIVIGTIRLIPASLSDQRKAAQLRTDTPEDMRALDQQHQERRADALARIQLVMGSLPGPEKRVPLEMRILEEHRHDTYVRQKITYAVEPGDRVSAWLLIPREAFQTPGMKLPAMLCLHQTVSIGKDEPAGLGGNPNLHYAKELAERGYVALAPDYLGGDIPEVGIRGGFGENRTDPYQLGYVSGSMKGIWNHIRAVDLIESLPFVDGERIGVIGHSLGGYNSLFVAAFEPRLKVVVSSCGFTSFPKYRGGDLTGWSHRGHMPRIASIYDKDPAKVPFDFPDVLAAIVPRALFINAPTKDFFDVSGVKDCVEAVRPLYVAFGAADRLAVVHPETGHDFPPEVREAAYRFVDKYLR